MLPIVDWTNQCFDTYTWSIRISKKIPENFQLRPTTLRSTTSFLQWFQSPNLFDHFVLPASKMKFYENSIVHNPKLELQNAETAKKVSRSCDLQALCIGYNQLVIVTTLITNYNALSNAPRSPTLWVDSVWPPIRCVSWRRFSRRRWSWAQCRSRSKSPVCSWWTPT